MTSDIQQLFCCQQQIINKLRQSVASSDVEEMKKDLRRVFSCIDNTTLNGDDTANKVAQFCELTKNYVLRSGEGTVNVASVCVYPTFVALAKKKLSGTSIMTAAVAGGFPSGQTSTNVKMEEVRYVVDEGADEIDFVINRGRFLCGDLNYVFDEIAQAREIGHDKKLKVILETGELESAENIYNASMLALDAGADFVKTSTGKIAKGASAEAAFAMLLAMREYVKKTKKQVGIKVSGGISDPMESLVYYRMTKIILDIENIDKQNFRVGASRLTSSVFKLL